MDQKIFEQKLSERFTGIDQYAHSKLADGVFQRMTDYYIADERGQFTIHVGHFDHIDNDAYFVEYREDGTHLIPAE